jgi:Terpene synthase family 2, C-terminal metal binding
MLMFRLPDLYCPFPSALNPYAREATEQSIAWAQHWGLAPHPLAYHQLAKLQLGQLAGLTHPTASAQALQLIADWCTWLFLHDDLCDEAALSHQPEALAHWHAELLALMEGEQANASVQPGMTAGFADLWQRSIVAAPPGWARRFRKNLTQFFAANVWEAGNRARRSAPDLETYMHWRPLTSGMYMFIDLIEVANHITLPPELLQSPLLQQLCRVTARGACWVNDIVSFEKEARLGELHNLVVVLAATQHLPYDEAMARAAAIHDHDVRVFIAAEQRLLAWNHLVSQDLQRYIKVLRSYLRGNLDWTSQSVRYREAQVVVEKAVGSVSSN